MAIKAAALKTQRQKHKIDLQTGEHIVDRLILQRAFDCVTKTIYKMDQELKESRNQDADINCLLGVVTNATKGFIRMTQEQMGNKQSRTPPIHSTIKWNNLKKKKPNDNTNVVRTTFACAFLVEQFLLQNQKSVTNNSGIRLSVL
jgi:hypothetical protein